jgi:uncharacterized protein YbjT (DUF2867 family)
MKIVVIGGSGLIGKKLAAILRGKGHEVVAASPSSGVNAVTGEGLAEVLRGAQTVVDVANSPSFEDQAVLDFFEASSRNLLAAEAQAGVQHHVALSVVGSERNPDSGYLRAKVAQEAVIKAGGVPYTILRATQFFEFTGAIAYTGAQDDGVHLPTALYRPIVSDDVVAALADVVLAEPRNGTVEVAGPELVAMSALVERWMRATGDTRPIVASAEDALLRRGDRRPVAHARSGRPHHADALRRLARAHDGHGGGVRIARRPPPPHGFRVVGAVLFDYEPHERTRWLRRGIRLGPFGVVRVVRG